MNAADAQSPASKSDRHLYVLSAIAVAICAIYGQTLGFDFVGYDDDKYITENALVQQGLTPSSIAAAFTDFHYANWHPLTTLSHEAAYALFGLRPWGHHLLNVLLHLVNCGLLYWVLFRYTDKLALAAAVAILYAVHPLHVESVAWVSARKDVLSTCFGLLALLAYRRYALSPRAATYTLVLFVSALALLSKSMLVTLPLLFLLLDFWPLERYKDRSVGRLLLEKVPLLLLSAGVAFATYAAQGQGGAVRSFDLIPIGDRFGNAAISYLRYIQMTAWPTDLAMLYPYPSSPYATVVVLSSVVILVAASALICANARRVPYLAVGWLWYLITLLPVIGLIQVGSQSHADRYTYLPHIGLFILVVWGVDHLLMQREGWKRPLPVVLAVLVLVLVGMSWRQTRTWQNSIALYGRAVAVTENNFTALNNLGNALLIEGQPNQAIPHLQHALDINPDHVRSNANLANAYTAIQNFDEAIGYYRRALDLDPQNAETRTNLANTLLRSGQFDEAIVEFRRTLEIAPELTLAYNGLGACYYQLRQYEQAVAAFEQSLVLDPNYANAAKNLEAARAKLANP